jgi:hypothetical protein
MMAEPLLHRTNPHAMVSRSNGMNRVGVLDSEPRRGSRVKSSHFALR